jgi:prepilin-type N-terminal cleavage/methylation domain
MISIKLIRGFSLIEVIIASALFTLTFIACLTLYKQIYRQGMQLFSAQQSLEHLQYVELDFQNKVRVNRDVYTALVPTPLKSGDSGDAELPLLSAITQAYTMNIEVSDKVIYSVEAFSKVEGEEESIKAITLKQDITSPISQIDAETGAGTISQQIIIVITKPYQSHWHDVKNIGPLTPYSKSEP